MGAPMKFYTSPTSSSTSGDVDCQEVREYRPLYVAAKPEWLANTDPERIQQLEQRMATRTAGSSYPDMTPSKRKRDEAEPDESTRFKLTDIRHAAVEPFRGEIYVKIREFVRRKSRGYWSSPRGINLRLKEWKKLVELMPAINDAVQKMEVSVKTESARDMRSCIRNGWIPQKYHFYVNTKYVFTGVLFTVTGPTSQEDET